MLVLFKLNLPKDGRETEWITACCLPGVSSSVVSLPPHHSVARMQSDTSPNGNDSMCYLFFLFFVFFPLHHVHVLRCEAKLTTMLLVCSLFCLLCIMMWISTNQNKGVCLVCLIIVIVVVTTTTTIVIFCH